MHLVPAKKNIKVKNGDNQVEVATSYPQYDSIEDATTAAGSEEGLLNAINYAAERFSDQYVRTYKAENLSDEVFTSNAAKRRESWSLKNISGAELSARAKQDVADEVMSFLDSTKDETTYSREQLIALIQKARG